MSTAIYPTQAFTVQHAEEAAQARPWFLVAATLLIATTYVMPLDRALEVTTVGNWGALEDFVDDATEGSRSRQISMGLLGLFGLAALALPGGSRPRIHGMLAVSFGLYLAWCGLSCLWSDEPDVSIRRYISLICEVAGGVAIAKHATPRQFIGIVLACCLAWMGLAVFAEVSQGTMRPWEPEYRFAGIFHPNDMGVACGLAVIGAGYLSFDSVRWKTWLRVIAAASFFALIMTGSRTATATVLFSVLGVWLLTTPVKRIIGVVVSCGFVAAVLSLVFADKLDNLATGAANMGRVDQDVSTMTYRVPLWQALAPYVAERPVLGYGYNAFWTPYHIGMLSDSDWGSLYHAHSMYIDLILSVGIIGALLCLSAMLMALVRAVLIERAFPGSKYAFFAVVLVYCLVSGITETKMGASGFLAFFAMCGISFVAFFDAKTSDAAFASERIQGRRALPVVGLKPQG